jgi:G6PDH family F420-dependent oxidoreductase
MRELWQGGFVTHRGRHYTVEHAQIYSRPAQPPEIYMSGFGPKAIDVAARIADGFISTKPAADDVQRFRANGGGQKVAQVGYKVCWSRDDETAVKTAHRLWGLSGVPGELSQVLPSPRHFEQVSELVTEDMTRDSIAYGDDVSRHVEAFRPFAEAGYDEIYISQIGGADEATGYHGFFDLYRDEVLPELRGGSASTSVK